MYKRCAVLNTLDIFLFTLHHLSTQWALILEVAYQGSTAPQGIGFTAHTTWLEQQDLYNILTLWKITNLKLWEMAFQTNTRNATKCEHKHMLLVCPSKKDILQEIILLLLERALLSHKSYSGNC